MNWIHFWLNGRKAGDAEDLQALSSPSSVLLKKKRIVGNISTEADMEIFRRQFTTRL